MPRAGIPCLLGPARTTFREEGITLDINGRKCADPNSTDPDATDGGPAGLDDDPGVTEREGGILCHVDDRGSSRTVERIHYPEDEETTVRVLNVDCALYPSDAAREEEQIAALEAAMEALVAKAG